MHSHQSKSNFVAEEKVQPRACFVWVQGLRQWGCHGAVVFLALSSAAVLVRGVQSVYTELDRPPLKKDPACGCCCHAQRSSAWQRLFLATLVACHLPPKAIGSEATISPQQQNGPAQAALTDFSISYSLKLSHQQKLEVSERLQLGYCKVELRRGLKGPPRLDLARKVESSNLEAWTWGFCTILLHLSLARAGQPLQ